MKAQNGFRYLVISSCLLAGHFPILFMFCCKTSLCVCVCVCVCHYSVEQQVISCLFALTADARRVFT
jgi:hypothetical protein